MAPARVATTNANGGDDPTEGEVALGDRPWFSSSCVQYGGTVTVGDAEKEIPASR